MSPSSSTQGEETWLRAWRTRVRRHDSAKRRKSAEEPRTVISPSLARKLDVALNLMIEMVKRNGK